MEKNAINVLKGVCKKNVLLAEAIATAYRKTEELDNVTGTHRPEGEFYDRVVKKALGLNYILEEEVKKVVTEEEWTSLCASEEYLGEDE